MPDNVTVLKLEHRDLPSPLTASVASCSEGNRVVISLDDDVMELSDAPTNASGLALTRLYEHISSWPDTRAVGFFDLPKPARYDEDLAKIALSIKDWIVSKNFGAECKFYFLIDIYFGEGQRLDSMVGERVIIDLPKVLSNLEVAMPQSKFAILSMAGGAQAGGNKLPYKVFKKNDIFPLPHPLNTPLDQWLDHSPVEPPPPPPIHPDPYISDAVLFYGSKFQKVEDEHGVVWKGGWDHDQLQTVQSEQWSQAVGWLFNLPKNEPMPVHITDDESLKTLFVFEGIDTDEADVQERIVKDDRPIIWKSGVSGLCDKYRPTRILKGQALMAIFKKLGIKVEVEAKDGCGIRPDGIYRMPCNPCLPFFVSLKSLICEMGKGKYHPPKVYFRMLPDHQHDLNIYTISLNLEEEEKDGSTPVPPWGLSKCYWRGDWRGRADGSTTMRRLHALTEARTIDFNLPSDGLVPSWLKIFTKGSQIIDEVQATDGPSTLEYIPAPAAGLEFAPHWVHIIWMARDT